jgi:hypothetical protein
VKKVTAIDAIVEDEKIQDAFGEIISHTENGSLMDQFKEIQKFKAMMHHSSRIVMTGTASFFKIIFYFLQNF